VIVIEGWELWEKDAGEVPCRQANKGGSWIRRNLDDSFTFCSMGVSEVPPSVARWLMAPKLEQKP
jgi:hypothetical protein